MICPVCHHTNIKEGAEECPKCNTPLTGDNLILALQKSNRDQRNQKIAMTFAVAFVVVVSAAYIFMVATADNSPDAGVGEVVVPGDSLRNLGYTLEENANHIQELSTELESLKAELSSLETETEVVDDGESDDSSSMTEEDVDEPQAVIEETPKEIISNGKTHVVSEGETLWGIAQSRLGDGFKSEEIASLNNLNDPNLIVVGETLRLR